MRTLYMQVPSARDLDRINANRDMKENGYNITLDKISRLNEKQLDDVIAVLAENKQLDKILALNTEDLTDTGKEALGKLLLRMIENFYYPHDFFNDSIQNAVTKYIDNIFKNALEKPNEKIVKDGKDNKTIAKEFLDLLDKTGTRKSLLRTSKSLSEYLLKTDEKYEKSLFKYTEGSSAFEELDTNKDGRISEDEVLIGLGSLTRTKRGIVSDILFSIAAPLWGIISKFTGVEDVLPQDQQIAIGLKVGLADNMLRKASVDELKALLTHFFNKESKFIYDALVDRIATLSANTIGVDNIKTYTAEVLVKDKNMLNQLSTSSYNLLLKNYPEILGKDVFQKLDNFKTENASNTEYLKTDIFTTDDSQTNYRILSYLMDKLDTDKALLFKTITEDPTLRAKLGKILDDKEMCQNITLELLRPVKSYRWTNDSRGGLESLKYITSHKELSDKIHPALAKIYNRCFQAWGYTGSNDPQAKADRNKKGVLDLNFEKSKKQVFINGRLVRAFDIAENIYSLLYDKEVIAKGNLPVQDASKVGDQTKKDADQNKNILTSAITSRKPIGDKEWQAYKKYAEDHGKDISSMPEKLPTDAKLTNIDGELKMTWTNTAEVEKQTAYVSLKEMDGKQVTVSELKDLCEKAYSEEENQKIAEEISKAKKQLGLQDNSKILVHIDKETGEITFKKIESMAWNQQGRIRNGQVDYKSFPNDISIDGSIASMAVASIWQSDKAKRNSDSNSIEINELKNLQHQLDPDLIEKNRQAAIKEYIHRKYGKEYTQLSIEEKNTEKKYIEENFTVGVTFGLYSNKTKPEEIDKEINQGWNNLVDKIKQDSPVKVNGVVFGKQYTVKDGYVYKDGKKIGSHVETTKSGGIVIKDYYEYHISKKDNSDGKVYFRKAGSKEPGYPVTPRHNENDQDTNNNVFAQVVKTTQGQTEVRIADNPPVTSKDTTTQKASISVKDDVPPIIATEIDGTSTGEGIGAALLQLPPSLLLWGLAALPRRGGGSHGDIPGGSSVCPELVDCACLSVVGRG